MCIASHHFLCLYLHIAQAFLPYFYKFTYIELLLTKVFYLSMVFHWQCARQGFALGLTLLVGVVPKIKVDSLLKLIVNLLETNSSMKGQVGE